ncbi:MAG: GNAT family N-acetyltransferase [Verrucomicrobiota bacterium]
MKSKPSKISFPPVASSDYDRVRKLACEIWPRVYRELISDAQISYMIDLMYSPTQLREDVESREIRYHWIQHDRKQVGFLAFGPVASESPSTLHKLYLLTEFQGMGIGSAALQWVVEELRSSRASEVHLRVNRGNSAAIRCYERSGFEKVGEDCLDIGEGFVMDDFLMRRCLNP